MKYDWQRYWLKCDSNLEIESELSNQIDDVGFLINQNMKYNMSKGCQLNSLCDINFLFLIGDSGIGKTTVLEDYQKELEQEGIDDGLILYLQLNECISLVEEIFQSEKYLEWLKSDKQMVLLLDGIDECAIEYKKVSRILAKGFKESPKKLIDLKVRISSRASDLKNSYINDMKKAFGVDSVHIYQLAPLQFKDVELACEVRQIEVKRFYNWICDNNLLSFASIPLTLKFLFDKFQSNDTNSLTFMDLFKFGIEKLLNESNQFRSDYNELSSDLSQRIIMASRLAALLLYCKKNTITFNSPRDNDNEISIMEVLDSWRTEKLGDDFFVVSENEFLEVVSTSLFRNIAQGKYCFVHKSYMEYLGAMYLVDNSVSDEVIRSIYTVYDGINSLLCSQLSESFKFLIPNLSESHSFLISEFIKTNPLYFISKGAILEDEIKLEILTTYFSAFDEKKLDNFDFERLKHYSCFKVDGLTSLLSSWLKDQSKWIWGRQAAIEFIGETKSSELEYQLMEVLLNDCEAFVLREASAKALVKLNNSKSLTTIKENLTFIFDGDPSDEIKGYVLNRLYPDFIGLNEMLPFLAIPKNPHLFGSYVTFLIKFARSLSEESLDAILRWLEEVIFPELKDRRNRLCGITDEVLSKLLGISKRDDSFSSLSKFCCKYYNSARYDCFDDKWQDMLMSQPEKRKKLLIAILKTPSVIDYFYFYHSSNEKILVDEDFNWILSLFQKTDELNLQRNCVKCLRLLVNCSEVLLIPAQFQKFRNCMKDTEFYDSFCYLWDPIEIESEQATKQRKHFQLTLRNTASQSQAPTFKVEIYLQKIKDTESNNFQNLLCLIKEVCSYSVDGNYCDWTMSDITNLLWWQVSNNSIKSEVLQQIVNSIEIYKHEFDIQNWSWSRISEADLFISKAIVLI
ncbi:hypothetical protein MJH12_13590, partial [bacterium]|nr:hypothetical protein [bacterium]